MAPAKQMLILIFISAHIIFATCKDANSATPRALAMGLAKTKDEKTEPKDKDDDDKENDEKKANGKEANGEEDDVANKVANKMRKIEKKITTFNASLKKRMDNPESSHGSHECVSECDEVLGAAIDDIKKTLDSIDNQNLAKANFDVSAVSTNVDTCNDCFDEMVGGDSKAKKLSDWVQKTTGDVLEALQKAES
ncbi:hypothetical protein E3N88_06088 [Mikania micrantha]|uniref:Pectinesterase inhibitor domain-containing protein n=1 Tax=Mikania micrantha TaxID=192012 RepID=A0A5N6PNM7_9ASTR|nr:hypothetical protein E3N88_06080 [Mikania micrantha]KAD6795192.1 hypothetical protein E3N88_06088 [Mikania micrantha]